MNLTIDRKQFLAALTTSSACLATRTTLPILSCCRLDATDDRLTISATDLDIAMTVATVSKTVKSGAGCVALKRLKDTLAIMTGESIEINHKQGKFTFSDGTGSVSAIPSLPADEFPPIPSFEAIASADVELAPAFTATLPFVSDDPSRWILNSVCLQGDGEHLTAVAVDGKRLRTWRMDCPLKGEAIIPTKAATIISRMKGTVCLSLGTNAVRVVSGDVALYAKLIEGDFPNWTMILKDVAPAEGDDQIAFPRDAFLRAIDFCATANPDDPCLQLSSNGSGPKLESRSFNGGYNSTEIPGASGTLKQPIAFHAEVLASAIESIDGDQQILRIKDNMTPVSIGDAHGVALMWLRRVG